jgi:tol-pal system protein YbgF
MKLNALAIACVLTAAAVSPAPVAAADKETRQMMADLRMLQEQSQQLQNLIGQLTDALKTLDTRLGGRIDDQTNTTRKALADEKLIIDTVSTDLRVLREKVDDNNVRVGSLTQEVDALRQLVTQLGAARTTTVAPDDVATGSPVDAGTAGLPPPAVGASPKQTFDGAMNDYYSGDYGLAISGFQAYINSFPKAEQAAEAQFNIGTCYLNDGKYQQAIEAYNTTIRTYPASKWVPDSYYKKGVALQTLGQSAQAREAFDVVIKTYPETDAARLATQRLPELTGTTGTKK